MIEDDQIKAWYFNQRDNANHEIVKVLDVEYAHIHSENQYDLYLTKYGLPFSEILKPEHFWTDKNWFRENSERLSGTSSIYKVRTKNIKSRQKYIVIKWNRMGQDIPGENDCTELANAEFNSPFEEFSLVMALRSIYHHPIYEKIFIQKPLAIYTPIQNVALQKSGRREYRIKSKINSHKDIQLNMYRLYAVIYEWIKGIDAVQANQKGFIDEKYIEFLTVNTEEQLQLRGFTVLDRKSNHIIVRPTNGRQLLRNREGKILYGLIDFELLQRTSEEERQLKQMRRHDYLIRQRDRFQKVHEDRFHPHLNHMNILNVDYIFGHVESTKGALWVVGDDPFLFDYFLPERWKKTPKTKLSRTSQVYHTVTKDNIHLVWKVSKVGIQPNMDPFKEAEKNIMKHGYNSPFEEFSIAFELSSKGIPVIYPRAIYMTGDKTIIPKNIFDNSRYETHSTYQTPHDKPILKKDRDYIIIWGFWNGPDEKLASKDGDYYQGVNALYAFKSGIITEKKYLFLLKTIKDRLLSAGIEDLNLTGSHFLISIDEKGSLIKDIHGVPELRICNFQFLKRM
jgi:hypothetical protein